MDGPILGFVVIIYMKVIWRAVDGAVQDEMRFAYGSSRSTNDGQKLAVLPK